MSHHILETIEVKNNVWITARERGKIVARREGHNIWLNLGREYLAGLMAYQSFAPDTPERDDRVKYIALGIGGNRQLVSPVPNPVNTAYPGTNVQDDTDATVLTLERPVRVSGSSVATPGADGDVWAGRIQAPAVHSVATRVTFTRLFEAAEVSYSPYLSVPVSEVGLMTAAADVEVYNNTLIAYDTFDTISKTSSLELEVVWEITF